MQGIPVLFEGTQGCQIMIWGYEGGLKSDLGVRDYQKAENPWFSSLTIAIRILY